MQTALAAIIVALALIWFVAKRTRSMLRTFRDGSGCDCDHGSGCPAVKKAPASKSS